jgi:chromodomain-helicase-DNA-binding protein 1
MTFSAAADQQGNESDISEGLDAPNSPSEHPSPSEPEASNDEATNHVVVDHRMSESEESSVADASEDGDFDMQATSPSQHGNDEEEDREEDREEEEDDVTAGRASSTDSARAPKRKAPVEDEYMKANPELYGLRRSVWLLSG